MISIESDSEIISAARMEEAVLVIAARGEIDLQKSPQLRGLLLSAINEHHPRHIVLNLAEVPYVDSSAIAVMVEALRKVKAAGGKMFLTDLHPRVKGLLEIARLNTIFVISENEAAAMAEAK